MRKIYVAVFKENGKEFIDYQNKSGCLTNYIKKVNNISIPSLYKRKKYYKENNKHWFEQYFDVVEKEVEETEVKKCPYCDWTTVDINNNSGAFIVHLKNVHNKSVEDYLVDFSNDREYFKLANKTLDRQLETDSDKYVVCKVCGKKFSRIDNVHLKKHNLTKEQYLSIYNNPPTICKVYKNFVIDKCHDLNLNNVNLNHFYSNGEKEIMQHIKDLGFDCRKDRKLLDGQEIDIFIPSKNIAIEYNGNKWHTEKFGKKDKDYHLNKTNICNEKGINLIHIFEDEYVLHKEVVLDRIDSILGIDKHKEKININDCIIKIIQFEDCIDFLNKFSLKYHYKSDERYVGCFINANELISVLSFNDNELTDIVFDIKFDCSCLCQNMFNLYAKTFDLKHVIYYLDKRWNDNNIEHINGFRFESEIEPKASFYNTKVHRYKRFSKEYICHLYKLSNDVSDDYIMNELGFDRIFDVGYYKLVWNE